MNTLHVTLSGFIARARALGAAADLPDLPRPGLSLPVLQARLASQLSAIARRAGVPGALPAGAWCRWAPAVGAVLDALEATKLQPKPPGPGTRPVPDRGKGPFVQDERAQWERLWAEYEALSDPAAKRRLYRENQALMRRTFQ